MQGMGPFTGFVNIAEHREGWSVDDGKAVSDPHLDVQLGEMEQHVPPHGIRLMQGWR